jgi:hypothetical protein
MTVLLLPSMEVDELPESAPLPDVELTLNPAWTYRVTRRKTDLVKRLDITVSKSTTVKINGVLVG